MKNEKPRSAAQGSRGNQIGRSVLVIPDAPVCERDWALALNSPNGLFPNCAMTVHEWGARHVELREASR